MIISIIQARAGSSRLPGKVLIKIQDKTVLNHVVSRVSCSKYIDDTFVATTILEKDLKVVEECSNNGFRVFCGSENDVLDRYYQIAKIIKPQHIVRITADCPVIDPNVIDLVIREHIESNADYTSNTLEVPYPDGQDVEVFSFYALKTAWENATLASEREHVTPFIKFNEDEFKIHKVFSNKEFSKMRWTLDEKEDLELIKIFYEKLYSKNNIFSMNDILKLIEREPVLLNINDMHIREAGYFKSLENDYLVK